MDECLEEYLAELRAKLVKRCGRGEVEEVINEARNHLRESASEHESHGASSMEAQRLALEEFGTVETAADWYVAAHGRPPLWKVCWLPLGTASVTFLLYRMLLSEVFARFPEDILALSLSLILCILASFFVAGQVFTCAKRSLSWVVVFAGVSLLAISISYKLNTGVLLHSYKYGHFDDHIVTIQEAEADRTLFNLTAGILERKIRTLRQGVALFATMHEPSHGVGIFHTPQGYLCEVYFEFGTMAGYSLQGLGDGYARHSWPSNTNWTAEQNDYRHSAGKYSTYEKARETWESGERYYCESTRKMEPSFIADAYRNLAIAKLEVAEHRNDMSRISSDRIRAAFEDSWMDTVLFTFVGLMLDLVGVLGRYSKRERRRTGKGPILT